MSNIKINVDYLTKEQDDDIECCTRATAYSSMREVLGDLNFIKESGRLEVHYFNKWVDSRKI